MSQERRKHPRIEASLRVRYKTIASLAQAYSSDISEGGIYVPTNNLMPTGAVVELRIMLPENGPELTAIARVAHVLDEEAARKVGQKQGMGMEFLDIGGTPVDHQIAQFMFKRGGEAPKAEVSEVDRANVLVVDDSAFHREQTAAAIRNAGHNVVTAEDGLEALRVVVREKLDLIISDVKMPNMNGWHLLRMIRNRPSLTAIPVIFLTTLNSDEERLMGYKLGVDDFIGKGFTEQEFLARVHRVLARSKAKQGGAKDRALRGDLSHVSLSSLLSLLEMERRTGHLLLLRDNEIANLLLREGRIVFVDVGKALKDKSALDRIFYVLGWDKGEFELSASMVTGEDTVGRSIYQILLEHAKLTDENKDE